MSGSWWLGPACKCLLVVYDICWYVHQQMKNICEKQHQHRQWWTVFVDVWGDPHVGNPPLIEACGLTSAEACCCCCCSCSSSSSKRSTSLTSAPDSESVSATRISLMASSSNLIFFPAIAEHVRQSALLRLLSVTGYSCRNKMPWRYGLLTQ